jgi:hypothetical protein
VTPKLADLGVSKMQSSEAAATEAVSACSVDRGR